MLKKYSLFVTFFMVFLQACNNDYIPKPRGYFRIDLPKKNYILFDTTYPFSFEYPRYAVIMPDRHEKAEPYWINIVFPDFRGVLHLSYKPVLNDNLYEYMEDAHIMVNKHIPKASSIQDELIYQPEIQHYGLKYRIYGTGAASPYQFILTDIVDHFLRGALYFNFKPNNDSMAPVIQFLEDDIDHLIQTLRWN